MQRLVKRIGRRLSERVARTSFADAALRSLAERIRPFEERKQIDEIASAVSRMIALEERNHLEQTATLRATRILDWEERKKIDEIAAIDKEMQILLSLKYKELLYRHLPLPSLAEAQFRSYSQNGEDGILLYIFSLIGTTSKTVVEMCAGNGIECNAANLILNHRWIGLLFDGDEQNIQSGKTFYAAHRDTNWLRPTLAHAWITAENVNDLIRSNGVAGEIDLLSLDMDGMDYWIWKAMDCIRPRVVVLEYNWVWGTERSVTVPYTTDFVNTDPGGVHGGNGWIYFGGSLPAFVKLAREKGYRLVGCEEWGFNAFFIRADVGEDVFPEIEASKCFEIPMQRKARHPDILKAMDPRWKWVEV
ncbi:MAG: hypothetical protein M3069_33280 [Chloroflexota bacterium]|nr:hypothetical protein [Chloroflexota bacterium]